MRVTALVLLLALPTPGLASSAGWWTQAKQGKVVGKLTTLIGTAKLDLARKALLVGVSVALMCGAVSCDSPVDLGSVADMLMADGDEGTDIVIRIGMNYDGTLSRSALSGAELAIAQVNAANHDNGVQLELLARDSLGDSNLSYQLTSELITEQMVHAVIGPSAHALLVSEIAHQHKVPMLTTLATNPNITSTGNYIFMAAFTYTFQGQAMAKFATEELNASTAAVLTQGRNAYSRVLSQNFIENFAAVDGNEVLVQESYRAGDTNFAAQLKAVANAAPKVEVVFVPGVVPEVALVVKQGKKMGIDAIFIGADGWGNAGLIEAGGDALEGAYFLDHFSATDSTDQLHADTLQFIYDYRIANGGETPTSRAALGYDAVLIVTQAIARAGSLDGAAIRDEIAATVDYSGATSLLGFTDDRHAIKTAVVQTIQDGKIVLYQLITPD